MQGFSAAAAIAAHNKLNRFGVGNIRPTTTDKDEPTPQAVIDAATAYHDRRRYLGDLKASRHFTPRKVA